MKEKILELIPEFNEIKDKKLRESTLSVFVEAVEKGGWKVEDLDQIPFTLLLKKSKVSFLKHTRLVTQICIENGKLLNREYVFKNVNVAAAPPKSFVNMDYLISGAILHDVGKLLEYKRVAIGNVMKSKSGEFLRHPFSGMGISFGKGIPDEVLHIIAVHSKEGDHGKRSPEAVILHHADFTSFESLKWDEK